MSYRIYKFGSTTLPTARITGTFGTGGSLETGIPLIGGMIDTRGDGYVNLRLPHEIVYGAWIVDTAANAMSALQALQALRGVRARLYRINEYDDTEHWAYARLMQVRAPWQYQRKTMQPVDLTFQMLTPWYEDAYNTTAWTLDDGKLFDDGLFFDQGGGVAVTLATATTVTTLNNGGNAPSRYFWVEVTAKTSAITSLSIIIGADQRNYVTWTGTLLADKTLIIDGRSRTVKNNGVNETGSITLSSLTHVSDYWFELEPGNNSVRITRTGGGATSTIAFRYADCWS
jgi:hypothetical protein